MKTVLRGLGVLLGSGLFVLAGLVIYLSISGQSSVSNRIADLFFLAVGLLGLWLIHVSVPGTMGRFLAEVPGAGRGLLGVLVRPRAFLNPIALSIWILVGIAAASVVRPTEAWLAGLIGFAIFTLVAPLAIAWQEHWWGRMLLTVWLGLVMFVASGALPQAITGREPGEGAMLYLAPLMWFPVALILSGVIRLMRLRQARRRSAP